MLNKGPELIIDPQLLADIQRQCKDSTSVSRCGWFETRAGAVEADREPAERNQMARGTAAA
jgi:hypothetical protein